MAPSCSIDSFIWTSNCLRAESLPNDFATVVDCHIRFLCCRANVIFGSVLLFGLVVENLLAFEERLHHRTNSIVSSYHLILPSSTTSSITRLPPATVNSISAQATPVHKCYPRNAFFIVVNWKAMRSTSSHGESCTPVRHWNRYNDGNAIDRTGYARFLGKVE